MCRHRHLPNPPAPDASFTVASYDDVKKHAERIGRRRGKLVVATSVVDFNGMLHGLRRWSRAVGLLCGRRSRMAEDALAKRRNHAAHPSGHHVDTPVGALFIPTPPEGAGGGEYQHVVVRAIPVIPDILLSP
ncbi:hypothetical protein ACFWNT_16630 [Streptomyces sp. NPDC058409]|uniref:hypothetical protein n=1 Tax=Streptomyces sp. NPDC058409 TaxID=3346484 RepID=UPI0036614B6F